MPEVPRRRFLRHAAAALGILLAGAGLWQLGAAGAIHAKAWLAQGLLQRAWAATLSGTAAVRPWPWADTHPVARLQVPALGVDQIVLADASGRTLAFGPGLLGGTAAPGTGGHSVLSGVQSTTLVPDGSPEATPSVNGLPSKRVRASWASSSVYRGLTPSR